MKGVTAIGRAPRFRIFPDDPLQAEQFDSPENKHGLQGQTVPAVMDEIED